MAPGILCGMVLLLFAAAIAPLPQSPPEPPAATLAQGPFRGASDDDAIHVWARARAPGRYTIQLTAGGEDRPHRADDDANADNDFTLHWLLTGLRDSRGPFGWRIEHDGRTIARADAGDLQAAVPDTAARARIAFGSCAEEREHDDQPIWAQILAARPDALVLLGDTPYIDSNRLDVQRRRYGAFFADPGVAACLRRIATYATWDDHDYATNDRFGDVDDREQARRAFLENHALATWGDGRQGIYTRLRRGPIEVFVLDTRWFADTETSPLADGQRSLLGSGQIGWLQAGLRASTAPFKVLCCGMVWNHAVRAGKKDCWGNWLPERDGLLRWIGAHRIAGVVLVGGDLHVTRLIRHATSALCGYDVPECVTSPLAQDPIPANAGAIDGVLFDGAAPSTFLLIDAENGSDGPRLLLRFRNAAGEDLHTHAFSLQQLTPAK